MPGPEIDLTLYRTEAELIQALRCRKPDACTCLVKRFAALVYRPAMRILDDADDAEEVLQTTFIKACETFDSFEERSGLATWLYRIATNEALMLRRRKQAARVAPITNTLQSQDIGSAVASTASDPARVALSAELAATLEQALMRLPENLRLVFVLRDMQGLSTQESAALLRLSEGAVKVRLHRARRQLRDLLADYVAVEHRG